MTSKGCVMVRGLFYASAMKRPRQEKVCYGLWSLLCKCNEETEIGKGVLWSVVSFMPVKGRDRDM